MVCDTLFTAILFFGESREKGPFETRVSTCCLWPSPAEVAYPTLGLAFVAQRITPIRDHNSKGSFPARGQPKMILFTMLLCFHEFSHNPTVLKRFLPCQRSGKYPDSMLVHMF
ncbi:unnamed protein product [Pylaiella littoralis]